MTSQPTHRQWDERLDEKAEADMSKVVWQASYKKHRAIIRVNTVVPGWIHEYGQSVRWKVLEGGEELDKLAINRKEKE